MTIFTRARRDKGEFNFPNVPGYFKRATGYRRIFRRRQRDDSIPHAPHGPRAVCCQTKESRCVQLIEETYRVIHKLETAPILVVTHRTHAYGVHKRVHSYPI